MRDDHVLFYVVCVFFVCYFSKIKSKVYRENINDNNIDKK